MYQKKTKNDRYKPFTRQQLMDLGVDLVIDGVSTREIDSGALQLFFNDYKTLEVKQYSKRAKAFLVKKPVLNTKVHEKGMIGECAYFQVSLSIPHKNSQGIPLHRIVYAWFNDIIEPYNEYNEKMEICHKERFLDDPVKDSHITNIFYDTAKNNRAMRKGAKNQYWKK